jgi:hypothetical protein
LLFLLLIVGCFGDAAMTIRRAVQRELPRSTVAPGPSDMTIFVRTVHPFTSATWYTPDIAVTNSSASSITINAVELTAKGVLYTNQQPGAYPVAVASGRTQVLKIAFKLREDVWQTFFKEPADLRVGYVINGKEMTGHVNIIGDVLTSKIQ